MTRPHRGDVAEQNDPLAGTGAEHSLVEPEPGRRVAVFGGGPAGLTVAHELAERGFDVDVYERHSVLGGKVRSFAHPNTGTGGRADMPGNMGGHFFTASCPNIGETMARIPIGGGRTVLDNLTTGPDGLKLTFGWNDALARLPMRSADLGRSWQARAAAVADYGTLVRRVTPADAVRLGVRLLALVTSGEQRQWAELEHVAAHDYLDSAALSPSAKRLADILFPSGFCSAEGASTRALAQMVSYILGGVGHRRSRGFTADVMILNGPENTAWIDPWAEHLSRLGTRFHLGHTLSDITCADGRITGATVRDDTGLESRIEADWYVLAVPADKAAQLIDEDLAQADPGLQRIGLLEPLQMFSVQILLTEKASELRTAFTSLTAPWSMGNEVLTSVWDIDLTEYGDGKAVEFVSVQIDDPSWRFLPGMLYNKPAKDCTPTEIVDEVLAQLRHHLPNGAKLFADDRIHSVYFSPGVKNNGDDRPMAIDEPLLSVSPSCWENQPESITMVPNLFLAGSYTRNSHPGDTMDGANESGKRVANAILDAARLPGARAKVASCTAPRLVRLLQTCDDYRYSRGRRNVFDTTTSVPRVRLSAKRSADDAPSPVSTVVDAHAPIYPNERGTA